MINIVQFFRESNKNWVKNLFLWNADETDFANYR